MIQIEPIEKEEALALLPKEAEPQIVKTTILFVAWEKGLRLGVFGFAPVCHALDQWFVHAFFFRRPGFGLIRQMKKFNTSSTLFAYCICEQDVSFAKFFGFYEWQGLLRRDRWHS